MSTEPVKHDHLKDAGWTSFQVGMGMFFPEFAWIIPALQFLRGETNRKPEEEWQAAVHKALQEIDKRVNALEHTHVGQDKIIGLAHLAAVYLVKEQEDCLETPIARENILASFPACETDELDEAIMELQEDGYANTCLALGMPYMAATPSPELIFTYDPLLYDWFPAADACALYRLMEEKPEFESIMRLQPHINWPLRRLNAAALYLREEIFHDGIFSKELHLNLLVPFFSPQPTQRIRIKRLEADLKSQNIDIPVIEIKQ